MAKESRQCRPCDMAWGAIGVVAGIVLLYMGVDLLTGGALTAMITAPAREPDAIEEGSEIDGTE